MFTNLKLISKTWYVIILVILSTSFLVNLFNTNLKVHALNTSTATLNSSLNSAFIGDSITLTVKVTGTSGVPTGNVDFLDGALIIDTVTLDSVGNATFITNSFLTGTHSITVNYNGDSTYNTTVSNSIDEIISNTNIPTVNLISSLNPSIINSNIILSIQVTGVIGIPTGTVDIFDGTTIINTATLDENGNASFTASELSLGTHVLTVNYSGDLVYLPEISNTVNQQINLYPTITTINSSLNPTFSGGNITFNINVATQNGGPVPSGSINILDGTSVIGNTTINESGNGNFSINTLNLGSHNITANYLGDLQTLSSTSNIINQIITNSVTNISTNFFGSPAIFGQTIQFNFNVTDPTQNNMPSGNLNILDGTNIIGTITLDQNGNSVFSTNTLSVGNHNIIGNYLGDSNFQTSSVSLVQLINSPVNTTIQLISSNNPSRVGVPVGFNINVTANGYPLYSSVYIPTGTITLVDGLNTISTQLLDSAGNVSFIIPTLSVGTHSIKAFFSGSTSYNSSNSSVILQIITLGENPQITIDSLKNPALTSDIIPFTVQVKGITGTPTGMITLKEGLNTLQTLTLDNNGKTLFSINTLSPGIHNIVAIYAGDGIYNPNTASTNEIISNATNFLISIVGKDAHTQLTQTSLGSTINWTIQYSNNGKPITGAKIYFPLKDKQSYVLGSIKVPKGWDIAYSKDINCNDSSFNYTSTGKNGTDDINIKCIRFIIYPSIINSPSNASTLSTLSINSVAINTVINNFGVGDVLKVSGYKGKIFSLLHHAYSGPPQNSPILSCYDFNKSNSIGGKGAICDSVNGSISYPVKLGLDGIALLSDKYGVNVSSIATSLIIGSKLYFSYADDLGGGIMCWDMDKDNYCSGNGLNVRGQIKLHSHPWTDTSSIDPITHNGLPQGTSFDIVYNFISNELFSITYDGKIVCYSITLGDKCIGQPDSPLSGYSTGLEVFPMDINAGEVVLVNNKIYGTLSGSNTNQYIGCIDLNTRQRCLNWNSPKQLFNGGFYRSATIFPVNNLLCETHNDSNINQSAINCYDEVTDTFVHKFLSIDRTIIPNPWYLSGQNSPGRIYILGWNNGNVYCYLTDQDINTGISCAGWEGGKPIPTIPPGQDNSLYTVTQTLGCLFIASNTGNIYAMDPVTGENCNPKIITTSGKSNVILDASTLYCNLTDNVGWDKLIYNDIGVTPNPITLNASIYDLNSCTQLNGALTCSGNPLKAANLLLTSDHSLDLSDISYIQHKQLGALINYTYQTIPTPIPNFYIKLKDNNQPSICLSSLLKPDQSLCTNILTKTCASASILLTNNTNMDVNPSSCLDVLPYGGKTSEIISPNSLVTNTLICGNTNFNLINTGEVNPLLNTIPLSYSNFLKKNIGVGSGNFVQEIQKFVTSIKEDVKSIFKDTISPIIPLILNGIFLAGTVILILPLLVSSISGTSLNFFQILGLLTGVLSAKKNKYWGIIYDDETNKPVPFAVISLLKVNTDKSLTIIKSTISDLSGKYRIDLDKKDNYVVEIKASGYEPLVKNLNINYFFNRDEIIADLALIKINSKLNFVKRLSFYNKNNLINILGVVSIILSIIGLLLTISNILVKFTPFYLLLLILYLIIIILNISPIIKKSQFKVGIVTEVLTNNAIGGAAVRIYNNNRQLQIGLTNNKGIVRFNLPFAEYNVLSTKKGYLMDSKQSTNKFGLQNRYVKKDGYLDKDIKMNKLDNTINIDLLDSPFDK